MQAKIAEIFSSIQGEGIYTGVNQVFVRFYGCNLHCEYCDTKLQDSSTYSLDEVVHSIEKLYDHHHSISLTGGEPLLQVEFLHGLVPLLKERGYLVYLETNGTLFQEFSEIKDLVEIVSMDIKLPSSTACPAFWQEHQNFLKIAVDSNSDLFTKAVICAKTSAEDIKQAAELVSGFSRGIPLILQPNSFENNLSEKLNLFKEICSQYLEDVRVMRQEHKVLGVE